jgi:sorting nexin-25
MHPDATDSSGAGLNPAPAAGAGGRPARGSAGKRRSESRGSAEAAAAPRGPGGRGWRVPVAVAALSAVALSFLGPGCWEAAGGAGPCTVLLRLCLYLSCAAAAFLLGTLCALVAWSPRAPPPDFAAAWSRLAAAARRPLQVSTGLAAARAGPRALPGARYWALISPPPPQSLGDQPSLRAPENREQDVLHWGFGVLGGR